MSLGPGRSYCRARRAFHASRTASVAVLYACQSIAGVRVQTCGIARRRRREGP
jgi:hypothetical protein